MNDLSSLQTFLMKLIFPVIWISGFGIGTFSQWFANTSAQNGESKFLLLAWIAGIAIIWWTCAPLKRVWLDGMTLHASNYLREMTVPVAAIDHVSENFWINIRPVTIHFSRPTPFGDSIVFMPKARLFTFWSTHPVVAELEQLMVTARMKHAGY